MITEAGEKYAVSARERFQLLVPEWEMLGPDTEFTYKWNGGYERVIVRNSHGGGLEYDGVYHPNTVCETDTADGVGVCKWCGTVWW